MELLDLQESPGEIKGRKMELGFYRKLDNPLLQLFLNSTLPASLSGTFLQEEGFRKPMLGVCLNSCISDIVTLLRAALKTAN